MSVPSHSPENESRRKKKLDSKKLFCQAPGMDVPKALHSWRKKHGFPAERVAVAAGVSRATIYSWEDGHGAPHLGQLRAMEKLKPGLLAMMGLTETRAERAAR
jgi:DNA-binding XRE family transcriptional regulator